ncbi:hypothetical protein FS837_004757 [Tulasnella sp. UAMH 9824]|nr:hypothetical protein FS837_004757 [Tulasnella sp. UAMH 9824]
MTNSLPSSSQPAAARDGLPNANGARAMGLFILVLGASVSMTLMTDYVEGDLGYRQPYFIVYAAHSCMSLLIPLHLAYLSWRTRISISRYIAELKHTLAQQFPKPDSPGFNYQSLTRTVFVSATWYTSAALLWYLSVVFSPISDVTAIWSTNAFWTYIISVMASSYCITSNGRQVHKWEFRKLLAVSLASVGVAAVVYGGSNQTQQTTRPSKSGNDLTSSSSASPKLATLGHALALLSALSTAAWAVWYDRSIAVPEGERSRPPSPQPSDNIPGSNAEYQPLQEDDELTRLTEGTASTSRLRLALTHRLAKSPTVSPGLEYGNFLKLILGLTLGVTCPALLWYVSVVFAPISDVTALFNTNAFWAYVLSVILASSGHRRIRWEWKKLAAVMVACGGVFAVVYGGAQSGDSETRYSDTADAGSTIFGDTLALTSSVCYAIYQVLYKRYAVLDPKEDPHQPPSPRPTGTAEAYQPLLTDDSQDGILSPPQEGEEGDGAQPHAVEPPFGLYPNLITSMIGVTTFFALWLPIPIMHRLGVGQPFAFPQDWATWTGVTLIVCSGLVFNAGFMILIGVWGPVVVSVGNLLTIVLVLASDAVFGNGLETITIWSLLGCGMIVGAFGILAVDVLRN